MIDFFQPDNFQTLASIVMWAIGGFGLLITGIAGWTLAYIIQIAKNMAETKAYCHSIDRSLGEFKHENERDHDGFGKKITDLQETQVQHGMTIQNLQKGSC